MMRKSPPRDINEAKNLVQSLAKGFRVLQSFSADEPELNLAEIARRSEIDNATAFRMLNTLVMLGYVERVIATRNFRLTLKPLELGYNALARMDLRDAARPVLRSLVGTVNEAASIGVREGGEVVYVARVQAGLARLGVDIRIGSRVPVYCTAIGNALIAALPRVEQRQILGLCPRVKLTPTTPVALADILRQLDIVKRDGYAISDQQTTAGLRVLAAPVLDAEQRPIAAVSVAAPSLRMPLPEFIKLATQPVLAAAGKLSRIMQAAGGVAHAA